MDPGRTVRAPRRKPPRHDRPRPPADDTAWVQVRLAAPARLGKVVLQRHRTRTPPRTSVQTSADGATRHTTATVTDGDGGVETCGRTAPRSRHICGSRGTPGHRFIYTIDNRDLVVWVVHVGHRSTVYDT
jgi:hypothetical protein